MIDFILFGVCLIVLGVAAICVVMGPADGDDDD
jgi:hypothetical protein